MIDYDLVDPAHLTGFVREVPTPANYTLNRWLPDRLIGDIEAVWDMMERTNRAAMFRSYDAETPIGRRDTFERRRTALPPLGQKTVIGEEERLKLERIRSGGNNTSTMVNAIYDDAVINTNATRARMELARGDVLTDGKFTLTGENGLTLEADFGVPAGHLVTASTLWSDHADSTPLVDLRSWADTYTDDAGEPPAFALTSRAVIGHLLQNESVRQLFSSLAGTPSIVTRTMLNQLLDAHDLPQLVEYHTLIDVAGTSTRPIPANRVVLLPQDPSSLGWTAWGITAEGLELASGDNPSLEFEDLPGLVGVVMKEGDPVRTWTKVTAVGMPVIVDPKRLMAATVLA